MLMNHDILCLSSAHWDSHMSTMQQTMKRLARSNRVLYINRPISILSSFSGNEEVPVRRQISEMMSQPQERSANLFVATSPIVVPLRYTKFSERINYHILIRWLRKTARSLGMKPSIVWTYLPESSLIVENVKKRLSVYHCVDDHCALGIWWNDETLIRRRETELLKKIDLVFATSDNLHRKQSALNKNCFFIPNGAEYSLFSKVVKDDIPLPPDIQKIKKPIIGYIGTFNADRLEVEWLEHAATHSDYSYVFIGKEVNCSLDMTIFKNFKNIYFLGFKEQSCLPGYLKAIDVCIMPYANSTNNLSVFPLKIFEYMAAGKPIVSRQINELRRYGKYLSLVNNKEDFLNAINKELSCDNKDKVIERMNYAKANSWDVRVEEMSRIVENNIPS